MTSWRTRLASGLLFLLLVAGAVRAASWLFAPVIPALVVLGSLAGLYLFLLRRPR